jgi:glycosyltransferase involved in cell wall biosynthesis
MKKILFIVPRFHTNLYYSIKCLQKFYNVSCCVATKRGIEDYSYLKPIIIKQSYFSKIICKIFEKNNKNNKYYFPKIFDCYKFLKKINPDYIFIRNYNKLFFLLVFIIAKLRKIKVIFYEQYGQDFFENNIIKFSFLKFLYLNFKIILITPIYSKFKKNKRRNIFYHVPFCHKLKSKNKKKNKNIKILSVGKFIKRKNFFHLIEVLKKIENMNYKFSLTIIGEASTKEHRQLLKTFIKKIKLLNFKNKVQLNINIDYKLMEKFYSSHDLFVLPAEKEPASISVIEALGHGIPVICSKKCGTSFYVKEKVNGLLFKEGQQSDLFKKLLIIFKNKNMLKKMSYNALKIGKLQFSEKVFINKFNKVLNES